MDIREKLVELIEESRISCGENGVRINGARDIADHLLAHDVTVQEWIPVTERLPDKELSEQKASANGHKVFPCLIVYEFNGLKSVRTAWYERSVNGEAYRFFR